jgi:MSHA biogenesis protein MshK
MAEYLNRALMIGLLSCCIMAQAENLPDPTRPPTGLGAYPNGAPDAGPVLQSVLISATRRIAIISGKTVKIGDKYGDAQVLSITPNEVVLRSGKDKQTLKLYPSLYKPASNSRAEGSVDGANGGK